MGWHRMGTKVKNGGHQFGELILAVSGRRSEPKQESKREAAAFVAAA